MPLQAEGSSDFILEELLDALIEAWLIL